MFTSACADAGPSTQRIAGWIESPSFKTSLAASEISLRFQLPFLSPDASLEEGHGATRKGQPGAVGGVQTIA